MYSKLTNPINNKDIGNIKEIRYNTGQCFKMQKQQNVKVKNVHGPGNSSSGMPHSQNNVTKFRNQTKCKIHKVYIITDYLENKAISD